MKKTPFIALALALPIAACNQGAENGSDVAPAPTEAASQPPVAENSAGPSAAMPATDAKGFVDAVAANDLYEVEAGRLAQRMAKRDDVRKFGAMMVEGHTATTRELTSAATSANVAPAPRLTSKHESDLTALRDAGEQFDTVYLQQQVAAHEMALGILRTQASSGQRGALRDFATKTAPIVEKHLTQARDLQRAGS